jgi:hypothetical protein
MISFLSKRPWICSEPSRRVLKWNGNIGSMPPASAWEGREAMRRDSSTAAFKVYLFLSFFGVTAPIWALVNLHETLSFISVF